MSNDETVADYDVRSPASRTFLTVIGTILTVGVIVGLVLGASILKRNTKVSTSTVELGGAAQIITIDAGSSDLRVVYGDDDDLITISARITSGLRQTDFQVGRRGNEIKILSGCQTWLSPGCGVDTTVEVPKGLPLVVRTTSGDVRADAITEGVLTVVSASGDISGTKLGLDEFSANTGSGNVTADFAVQPFAFKAKTDSGDISAVVPSGDRTYDVTATSKSGDVSSSLDSDTGGQGFVRATSQSGDITLK